MTPKAVLVAYEGNGAYSLESHPVLEDGTVGAAKSVSVELMRKIAQSFDSGYGNKPRGVLPRRLLYADTRLDDSVLVWWTAPGPRMLTFKPEVGLPDGIYNMPGVIYRFHRSLSVWAFAGKRPPLKAELYKGPFFNYYEDCRMCLGNSRISIPSEPTWDDVLNAYEGAFWNSLNAHLICDPMVKGADIKKELRKAMKAPFDLSRCRKAGKSLSDIYNIKD